MQRYLLSSKTSPATIGHVEKSRAGKSDYGWKEDYFNLMHAALIHYWAFFWWLRKKGTGYLYQETPEMGRRLGFRGLTEL